MITIRIRPESSTPSAEWVEALPENSKLEMVFSVSKERTVLEKIQVNGETLHVERAFYTDPLYAIFRRLLGRSVGVPESDLIALLVSILNK